MQDPFNLGGAFRGRAQCAGRGGHGGPPPHASWFRGPWPPTKSECLVNWVSTPGGQVWPVSEGLLTIPPLSSCCFFPDVLILEAVTLLGLVASWNLEPLPADNIPVAAGIPQALGSNTWRRRVPDTQKTPHHLNNVCVSPSTRGHLPSGA